MRPVLTLNLLLVVFLSSILLFATGCSTEASGVPEEIIRQDTGSSYDDITIQHNVNRNTHIDTVTITEHYYGTFGEHHETSEYQYEYNRASDLWTLLEKTWLGGESDLYEEEFIGTWYCEEDDSYLEIHHMTEDTVRFSYSGDSVRGSSKFTLKGAKCHFSLGEYDSGRTHFHYKQTYSGSPYSDNVIVFLSYDYGVDFDSGDIVKIED